ncbi:MAG: SIS domain-containing protein [Candidatus Lokiarchaeota archaeon]|nr:SIS domain-containing protein [Candidatus Lokiarchaeota archaeon]
MKKINSSQVEERFLNTLLEISKTVKKNSERININQILKLIDMIIDVDSSNGMIFVYGAGRSGFIGRCFAQRLMHLGITSCFVSDAVTYRYSKEDLLIIISGSGITTSPLAIAEKANEIGGKIALFTGNPSSAIGNLSDLIIQVEGKSKDQATSLITLAPFTSLFDISTLAILDSIGASLMGKLNITETDIDKRHASIE